tara:strand:- start:2117 stop:2854 length:738 start_codon:yes stop_codon:yes gene_type:complete
MSIYDDLDFGEEYGYEDRPDNWNRLFDLYVDSDAKDFAMAEITRGPDQFKANIIKEQAINAIDTALAATEVNLEKSYNAMNMNTLVGNSTGGFASSGSSKKQKEFQLDQVSLSKEQDIQNIKSTVLDAKMDTLKSRQAEVDKEWDIYNVFLGLDPDKNPDAPSAYGDWEDEAVSDGFQNCINAGNSVETCQQFMQEELSDFVDLVPDLDGGGGFTGDDLATIGSGLCAGVVCGDSGWDTFNPCCW